MTHKLILRDNANDQWIRLEKPKKILTSTRLEEVLPILQTLDQYIQEKKYYIAGFISYEAAAAFDKALTALPTAGFPLVWFALYEKVSDFVFEEPQNKFPKLDWKPNISKKEYKTAISSIQQHIQKGNTYQVNFTLQLNARDHAANTAKVLFENIAATAPYAALIELLDYTIVSASPELFFHLKNGKIIAKPMKGTAPRGLSYEVDSANKNQLFHSQKDRSENVMIVDMLRNDLSKIAEIGTVQTPRLYDIEQYPTVWQMTSKIEAETNANLSKIMKALFPCASITGAPKASTMCIIAALEKAPRNIYTGTIGFIKPDGEMQFNVAIRTALFDKKKRMITYGTGGGITIKSSIEKEYQECLVKTKVIREQIVKKDFRLLETMLWHPKDDFFLLQKHLERIKKSAEYFDYTIDIDKIKTALFRKRIIFQNKAQRVRLLLKKEGVFEIQNYNLIDTSKHPNKVLPNIPLAKNAIDSSNVFLYHKTTNRQIYEQALAQFPKAKDVILWNEKGEITESCFGNIVVFDGDEYWTPPVQCGLLNGTFRQYLLEIGKIKKGIILKEKLEDFEKVFIINSVRRWQEVKILNLVSV